MTYGMILSEATVCAVVFFVERGIFMARKSRKYQHAEIVKTSITKAVGYVQTKALLSNGRLNSKWAIIR